MKLVSAIFILFFIFAAKSSASVFISEIAWMGTANSANDEWIEIYNDGSENIDLNGWTLSANDGTPSINFSNATNKIIPAGGFYLLERTDDDTVLGLEADLIYTGALSNDGEVLVLKNTTGMSVHQVDGSDFWAIGGNLSTKETLQKISSGWITATGTPKSANTGQSNSQSSSSSSQTSSSSVSSVANSVSGSIVWPDEQQIYANAGKDKTGIAGADVLFEGKALGIKKEPLENAHYFWNFGDGSSGEGQNVKHIYKYPDKYIAVLEVSSGQYSTSDRVDVKISANELIVSEANNEFIKLKNKSGVILDISGWFLTGGGVLFKFPKSSFISAGAELNISSDISKIKFSGNDIKVDLLYSNGSIAFSYQNKKEIKPQLMFASSSSLSPSVEKVVQVQIIQPATMPKPTYDVGFGIVPTLEKIGTQTKASGAGKNLPAGEAGLASVITIGEKNNPGAKIWLILAVITGIIGGTGVFLARRKTI